ncbi:hypothetical protein TGME49_218450 [Toxoplasma gondii ME49]|uniref:Transmembrane protein n=1 Tax=Toxoplasma gondii (strain ATCC 50611 / Me49) TaxID=508771 RepID=S8EUP3_TOXGM|nr:hypothetical protein TGME49_218450 [Toxoplasma gondii ME49]EPT24683.1 hypothetical protein TGME49_218450 [Toxoplasma gondii ME49]|eukprot:XP_002370630.1 hypothetical protein TGME49_218450 [Toxoplasma gondii ME49]
MKAPEDSFAYAAENGLIEWADTKETRFSSTASSSDMVSEDRYNDSGDDRTKVERRHSKEGKKPTWGLNKQHERNSVKALKWQAETEPRNASRQTDDEGTEHGLEHKVPIDLHASPEKHEGRQEQMNQRMRGFHGSAATGYSTAASSGTEYGAAEKGQSDVTTESETKALALSREEDNDMSDAAMPANHDIIDTSGARETAGSENTQTTVTSPSSIRDNESYSAFLREFMRLHKQAKETLNRRRDSVAATDPSPEEVSASGETAGLPTDSSASSTEAVYGTGDEDPQDGVVGPPQILSGVDTKTENPATSASRLALELPQAMPSSADPPVELHNSADVTVLSRIDVSTANVALLPAAPASTPKPNGRTKQVPANSNVKILHVVTWCAGTAIFVVGAALILIYIRCWVVPQEPPASDGGSATTAPRSSSSPSLLAFIGCPAESSLSGPVPFQTGSCCSPSKDLGIPTVKTSESNPSPYANVGSPAPNGSESCSHSHTVSIVSFSGPECCDDGETNEGEQEIDTATSSTSRSAKFERIGCDTFVSAIVRGVRVAAGVSQVSRSTEDSVSGSTAVVSSQLPCRSSDNSRQSHRPSPAERLERLRARIDAL